MNAADDTATDVTDDAPPIYRPRGALAHVSASQPTGLAPIPTIAPKRGKARR